MKLVQVLLLGGCLVCAVGAQSVATYFNNYPPCANQCAQTVYNSQACTLTNSCLCSGCLCLSDSCLCQTSSWLVAMAHCIGKQCGASTVTDAAGIANSGCAAGGYQLAIPEQSLIAMGLAAVPTSTSGNTPTDVITPSAGSSVAVSQTPSTGIVSPSSQSSSSGSSGLSVGVIAAIVAIVGVVVLSVLAIGGYCLWRHHKKKKQNAQRIVVDPRDDDNRSHADDATYAKTFSDSGTVRGGGVRAWVNSVEMQTRPGVTPSESNFSGTTQIERF